MDSLAPEWPVSARQVDTVRKCGSALIISAAIDLCESTTESMISWTALR